MNNADVILVLGRGVYKDGSIPDSAKATIKTAVDLYNYGKAAKVLFSGKWTYKLKESSPLTEAEAMAQYAKSLGLPESAILLEKESFSTVSNIYYIKKNFLIPNNWHKVLLVSLDPVFTRAFNDLKKILGSQFVCELVIAEFTFPEDKYRSLIESEMNKLNFTDTFYEGIQDGDEKAIYQRHLETIKKSD